MEGRRTRGSQDVYDRWLDEFRAKSKPQVESIEYLIKEKGLTYDQAKDAVYVYFNWGGAEKAQTRQSTKYWDRQLDHFGAKDRRSMECIKYLVNYCGATYGQAKSAVYKYRKERGLIGK